MGTYEELSMTHFVMIEGASKMHSRFSHGLETCGDTWELAKTVDDAAIQKADAFFQNNLLKPKFLVPGVKSPYQVILETNKPFIVRESPVFREYEFGWQRLGWYSYKWSEGLFGNENSPPDRWNDFQQKTGIRINKWNSPGSDIVIMGQKEGDSSLLELYKKYPGFYDWVYDLIIQIRKYSDRRVVLRPHPRNLSRGLRSINSIIDKLKKVGVKNVILSTNLTEGGNQGGAGLDADLKNAYCVITWNSLSGVEAVCKGIPTFALENGSMVWPIAHKDISKIEQLDYNIDITQWCNDVMYTQWHNEELSSGKAWSHLKPLIFK